MTVTEIYFWIGRIIYDFGTLLIGPFGAGLFVGAFLVGFAWLNWED